MLLMFSITNERLWVWCSPEPRLTISPGSIPAIPSSILFGTRAFFSRSHFPCFLIFFLSQKYLKERSPPGLEFTILFLLFLHPSPFKNIWRSGRPQAQIKSRSIFSCFLIFLLLQKDLKERSPPGPNTNSRSFLVCFFIFLLLWKLFEGAVVPRPNQFQDPFPSVSSPF
jgi:hypothetical protein